MSAARSGRGGRGLSPGPSAPGARSANRGTAGNNRTKAGGGKGASKGSQAAPDASATRISTRSSRGTGQRHANTRAQGGTPGRNGAEATRTRFGSPDTLPDTSALAASRDPRTIPRQSYMKHMADLFLKLKENRERERKAAIRDGFLADPDKKTTLAEAITPVGTCQDMCPEFERVERIVQHAVDRCERNSMNDEGTKVGWEPFMVKRFRRSAAGTDDQIPSDIRPPAVLKNTLDYLLKKVVGGSEPLAAVHKFVWDRTRAIRNDFSIQQVSKVEDLRVAIECFECIARFHLLSLHQLSHPTRDNGDFDAHQEREQLGNTLLSLMYYYDDSRKKFSSPNEAEFRAYGIIFEIQDRRPDVEHRVQAWPTALLQDPRIQTALKLHAASSNPDDDHGPLNPRVPFAIAQANFGRFWAIIRSSSISYLAACAAEIYFNFVRSTALGTIYKSYRRPPEAKVNDLTLDVLTNWLGFDTEDQTQRFCEEHGFSIKEQESGVAYVDLSSVSTRWLNDTNAGRSQIFSRRLVEAKRHGRTLPAIIKGYNVARCKAEGLIDSVNEEVQDESLFLSDDEPLQTVPAASLSDAPKSTNNTEIPANPISNGFPATQTQNAPAANPFASISQSSNPFSRASSFSPFAPNSTTDSPSVQFTASSTPSNPFGKASSFPQAQPAASSTSINSFPPFTSKAKGDSAAASVPANPGPQPSFVVNTNMLGLPAVSSNPFSRTAVSGTAAEDKDIAPSSVPRPELLPIQNQALNKQPVPSKSPGSSPAGQAQFSQPSPSTGRSILPGFDTSTARSGIFSSPQHSSTPTVTVAPSSQTKKVAFAFDVSEDTQVPKSPGFPPTAKSLLLPKSPSTSLSSAETTEQLEREVNIRKQREQQEEERLRKQHEEQQAQEEQLRKRHEAEKLEEERRQKQHEEQKREALSNLAHHYTMCEQGVLEMYIEKLLGPIITKSMRKVAREKEKAEVAESRQMLLSIKYFRRWRKITYNKNLVRHAKARRQRLMEAKQHSQPSHRGSRANSVSSIASSDFDPLASLVRTNATLTPPRSHKSPESGTQEVKRKSFLREFQSPIQHPDENLAESTRHQIKRMRLSSPHVRSKTADGRLMVPERHRHALSASRSAERILYNQALPNESLLKKARRLVTGRTDTTRTDYFRLKAMGVSPDTPAVPETRKRPRTSDYTKDTSRKALRGSPPPPPAIQRWSRNSSRASAGSQPPDSPVIANDHPTPSPAPSSVLTGNDDDELFAKVREVRRAMAESESWFKSMREDVEDRRKSVTPQQEARAERLRSLESTPSRTSLRHQTSGSHGYIERWEQIQQRRVIEAEEKATAAAAAEAAATSAKAQQSKSKEPIEFDKSPINGIFATPTRPNEAKGRPPMRAGPDLKPPTFGNNLGPVGGGSGTSFDDAIEL